MIRYSLTCIYLYILILSYHCAIDDDKSILKSNHKSKKQQKQLNAALLYLASDHVSSLPQALSLIEQNPTGTRQRNKAKISRTREFVVQKRMKALSREAGHSSSSTNLNEFRLKAEKEYDESLKRNYERKKIIRKLWKFEPKLAKEVNLSKVVAPKPKGSYKNENLIEQRAKLMFFRKEVDSIEMGRLKAFEGIQKVNKAKRDKRAIKKDLKEKESKAKKE